MGLKRAPRVKATTGLPGREAELPEELLHHEWAFSSVQNVVAWLGQDSERRSDNKLCKRGGAAGVGESVFRPKPTRLTRRVDGVNGLCVYAVQYGGGSYSAPHDA